MTTPSPTNLPPAITAPPPPLLHTLISFPAEHILLVTLNRPEQLNAIPRPQHFALERLWEWFDDEPSLRCAVFTGSGRAFCAGADLKEWNGINSSASSPSSTSSSSSSSSSFSSSASLPDRPRDRFPAGGFGGLSNRGGKKPVVAAVNGLCLGGGMEMAINCDLVVAARRAAFALPEVTIGVIAVAGGLPRLGQSVGRQRAMEMALSGKRYSAEEMRAWGLVNEVVEEEGAGNEAVVRAALRWAERIAGNSPDAVIVSREGVKTAWEAMGPAQATEMVKEGWYGRMEKGENMVEGVRSFVEKRKPVWKDSKL